jgi:hypothetical protein
LEPKVNREEMFVYLDNIRETGKINMFGAAPYLQDAFGLSRYEAKDILLEWMDTFSERHKVTNGN